VGILQKLTANTVLLFLLAPSFVWLAMPDPQSALPSCCRRDGKHHCAMMAMGEPQENAPSLRASSPQCPYRSVLGTPMGRGIAGLPIRFAFFTETVGQSDRIVQVLVDARVSEARSHLKRGPPTLA